MATQPKLLFSGGSPQNIDQLNNYLLNPTFLNQSQKHRPAFDALFEKRTHIISY
jgi:hypothetical protein